jgi:two-component system CheB/CheR fusion protein
VEPKFPVVGIGASAGGLEALEQFFPPVPPNLGVAFVVVTHLDPHATSFLPELLGRVSPIPVREASNGQSLVPNEVVVVPPGKVLTLAHGVVQLHDIDVPQSVTLPIDTFFRSLADDQQHRAIGIVLSGTGTDGTLGLEAIQAATGMTMAQEPSTAKFPGMPQSAIDTGLIDYVLPPEEMPNALQQYVQGPYLRPRTDVPLSLVIEPEVLQDILSFVHAHTGHSFTSYKISTIRRRVERRLNLHQIIRPEDYLPYLREHPEELDHLFHELLIGVTSFFRDPEAFTTLATLLPELLRTKRNGEPIRVWVPGCSTGEEAYSLAILLREALTQLNKPCPVHVFATDLDDRAIDTARAGRYPMGIAADVNPEHLRRFFTPEDGAYQINREVREMIVFAPHNLLVDPPFSHVDLLSCRNLLIYLDTNTQRQVLTLFHYALRPGGLLFLGASETIGNSTDFFHTENRQWKIFRRTEGQIPAYPMIEHALGPSPTGGRHGVHREDETAQHGTANSHANTYLAERYAPPSVLITARGDIVHFHGRTGAYLEPPRGAPRVNIFRMAREGLDRVLPPAVRAALTQDAPFSRHGVTVATNGEAVSIDLLVERVTEASPLRGLLLVSFRPASGSTTAAAPASGSPPPHSRRRRLTDLERELQETRESLQSTIEELEAANEELTSANEELQSTNEETQSTNEELKTSKEEMQSLNEELQTVNAELRSKIMELSHANDDMANLLNSTDIATIFLDDQLQIKRYTTKATEVIALIPSDVGRPLRHLTSNLDYPTLVADATQVLRTLVVQEREVRTHDGAWYLVRLLPYRTSENVIDGLVVTFVDIDHIKRAEDARQRALEQLETEIAERQRSELSLRYLSKVFQEAMVPIILEDETGIITNLNAEAERVYGWTREELIGQSIKLLVPAEAYAQIDELLDRCRRGEALRNIATMRQTKAGEVLPTSLMVSPLTNEQGDVIGIATIATTQHPAPDDTAQS